MSAGKCECKPQRENASDLLEWPYKKTGESSVARMWGGGDPHGPSAGIGTGAVAAEHSTEVPPEVKTELPGGPAISLLGTELKEVKSRPGRGTCTPCSLQHASQWPRRKQAARPPWMSKDGAVRMRAAERGSALGRRGSRQPQRCAWTSKALRQVKEVRERQTLDDPSPLHVKFK